jgi:hypothetical protein
MRAALRQPDLHGQDRGAAIQRLNLALLINAQHQRALGWIEIQTDDVTDLVDEQRVLRQLERLDAMRLQREGPPHARDRGLAHAGRFGHRPRAPVRRVAWRRLQRHRDYALDVRVADLSRRPRPRFIDQPVEALPHEARAPLANGGLRHALMPRDRGVRIPGRRT